MDTIFDRLRNDHDKQRTLMKLLLKTSGDSRGRRELFDRLRDAIEDHAAAEERAFYSPLLRDEVGRKHAAHSIHEHENMRMMLDELEAMNFDSPAWLPKARKLVDKNTHHINEEEKEIFPVAGRVLKASKKADASQDFGQMRAEGTD